MIWVWVFLAIAVVGLVVMISYGVWLFHKAADVYSEIKMLGQRGREIQALVEQLELSPTTTTGERATPARRAQGEEPASKDLATTG
ncbi:hypothetical protein ACPCG0_00125 [Propionibacteriaceae bacterium Y1923]|uniref:hypothetical protein n=1 Tax=Aestuariimicrobium sp. Y1814 TaxID=3418742 RepID=UPI003C267528